MAKRVSKASKRRLMLFGTITMIIVGYFFFSLISYTYRLISLRNENKNLNKELLNLQGSASELTLEIQKLKDPDYLARYARENYYYTKSGEYVIRINPSEKNNEKTIDSHKYFNIIIGSTGVLIVIVMYIVIKKNKHKK